MFDPAARDALTSLPSVALAAPPTPIDDMPRLAAAIGATARLSVKRDDAIPFAFGGNKVRKLRLVVADALRDGADTLITCGGVQSNHARATAAFAARFGLRAILVANGEPPRQATANALLDRLLGARVEYVPSREARDPAMHALAARVRDEGGRPAIVPLGASTPLGAAAYAMAVAELLDQIEPPDVIVHATSSGGTQAGLVAGCRLAGIRTRVIGISADESAAALTGAIQTILDGMPPFVGATGATGATGAAALRRPTPPIEVDAGFVGDGYGIPTSASIEALELTARCEGLFLDPTYTAKAMAGLIAFVRDGRLRDCRSILFWHTGGQVGLFA